MTSTIPDRVFPAALAGLRPSFSGSEQVHWHWGVPAVVPGSQGQACCEHLKQELPFTPSNPMLITDNSLITATPEEGRELAMKMARLVIKATQPDDAVRSKLRDVYANDAMALLQAGQTVAVEFATIAAANNYWRK